jgi:hypothetical protein
MSIWNEKRFPRIFKVFFFLLISLNDDWILVTVYFVIDNLD